MDPKPTGDDDEAVPAVARGKVKRSGAQRPRRALAQDGQQAGGRGEPESAAILIEALTAIDPDRDDDLTHGFHSYPARMHFAIARTLIEAHTGSNTRVLDPFCGSGTVLVEATRRGLPATGVDLSTMALRIAEIKCARRDEEQRAAFAEAAAAIAEASAQRVTDKVFASAPIPATERRWYEPHVLLELAGLFAEIQARPDDFDRRALEMVFSAIVVKFSRQKADTDEEMVTRRIAKGAVTKFFTRKTEELGRRWGELAELISKDAPRVQLRSGDARRIPGMVGPKRRYDLIVSSPPYGGTYDYVDHHRRRRAWLDIDARELDRGEIGARRALSGRGIQREAAMQRWDTEMTETLISLAAVLSGPDAPIILLVGDGEIAGQRIDAAQHLRRLAPTVGLRVVAWAGVPRPDWQGGSPRAEHLVQLQLQPS